MRIYKIGFQWLPTEPAGKGANGLPCMWDHSRPGTQRSVPRSPNQQAKGLQWRLDSLHWNLEGEVQGKRDNWSCSEETSNPAFISPHSGVDPPRGRSSAPRTTFSHFSFELLKLTQSINHHTSTLTEPPNHTHESHLKHWGRCRHSTENSCVFINRRTQPPLTYGCTHTNSADSAFSPQTPHSVSQTPPLCSNLSPLAVLSTFRMRLITPYC